LAFRGSLQDIRLFVAAYEEKSFTAAATRENSTQSGVSHHIRQLEMLLNVKLFVREKAGVTATPVADLLYQRSIELLRSLEEASNQVARFSGGFQGSFTVGIIPALTHRIAAPTLLRFNALHPNVKVRIVEGYSSHLPAMVASGDIDFAIGTLHGGETGVEARPLLTTPECLVSRDDAEGRAAAWPTEPINMIWASGMEGRRAAIIACLAANGVRIGSSFEIDSALASLDLVGRSDWRMVNPAVMIDPAADSGRLSVRPLRNPDLVFAIMLLQRTSNLLMPEAEIFTDILVEEAKRATEEWTARFEAHD
jgi:LysR family nitrogen assimilation transcriptional regulator